MAAHPWSHPLRRPPGDWSPLRPPVITSLPTQQVISLPPTPTSTPMSIHPQVPLATPTITIQALSGQEALSEGNKPTAVPAPERFVTIASGQDHNCALQENGNPVCWGSDRHGESSPPPGEKFIAVSCGDGHTCALREDGSPVCWGLDWQGETSPPTDEKFITISSGDNHTCALRKDGTAVCWGDNRSGQASVPSDQKFTSITSSFDYTCGVREDAVTLCWGNIKEQSAMSIQEQLTVISGGFSDACGLRVDGTVVCWDKSLGDKYFPLSGEKLSYLGSHVSHAYYQYRCGIGFDGTAKCWSSDRLGRNIKIYPIPSEKRFVEIGTGLSHTCGVLEDGSISCWGDNRLNQSTPPGVTTTPIPTVSEMCEPGLILQRGTGCLNEKSSIGAHKFVITPLGRGDMYDMVGKLLESQYVWVDFSYDVINDPRQTYVVLRARENPDGSWSIDEVSHWE